MRGEAQIRGWKTRKRSHTVRVCSKRGCFEPATNQQLAGRHTRREALCATHYHMKWERDRRAKGSIYFKNTFSLDAPVGHSADYNKTHWERSAHLNCTVCPVCGAPSVYNSCLICCADFP